MSMVIGKNYVKPIDKDVALAGEITKAWFEGRCPEIEGGSLASVHSNPQYILSSYIEYALTTVRKEARAAAWRPIETAPKDSTRILAYFPDAPEWYNFSVICWSERHGMWWGCSPSAAGVIDGDFQASFWMPLPEPPIEAATNTEEGSGK